METEARFWSKVDKDGPIPDYAPHLGKCWLWTGGKVRRGYGRFYLNSTATMAHRFAYEAAIGPIPEGLQIDHLCRTTACCNPAHLEAVTQRENILRGNGMGARWAARTHCKNGHSLAGENLLIRPDGSRRCRVCANWGRDAKRRAKREARAFLARVKGEDDG